jgi:hypothetical protein
MPADGAAPQTIKAKRKRDPNARVRIGWAVRKEIAATPGLTRLGFELMGRREQLRRIKGQLEREGVPESEMPTARQLKAYWETHSSPLLDAK